MINLKRISGAAVLSGLLSCGLAEAQGRAVELKDTEETCKKVNSIEKGDYRERLSRKFNVSESSIRFMRVRWDHDPMGVGKRCMLVFDTAVGSKTCKSREFYTTDKGKSATAVFWSENLCY